MADASMECPICGIDTPHSHSSSDICKWLEAQGSRFGLSLRIFDNKDLLQIHDQEFNRTSQGRFEAYIESLDLPRVNFDKGTDNQYVQGSTRERWHLWQAAESQAGDGLIHPDVDAMTDAEVLDYLHAAGYTDEMLNERHAELMSRLNAIDVMSNEGANASSDQ